MASAYRPRAASTPAPEIGRLRRIRDLVSEPPRSEYAAAAARKAGSSQGPSLGRKRRTRDVISEFPAGFYEEVVWRKARSSRKLHDVYVKKEVYDPPPMGKAEAKAAAAALLSPYFRADRIEKAFENLVDPAAGGMDARETSGLPAAAPRPDWIEARDRREGKLVAGVLAQFINEKFADELADRTMSTDKLYRYKGLYQAFYDHRDKLPPELRSIPTKSRSLDRQVAEGKVKPVRPQLPPPPRTEDMKAYDRGRFRLRRARQRGVTP